MQKGRYLLDTEQALKEWYLDGNVPTPESLDKKRALLYKNAPIWIRNIRL